MFLLKNGKIVEQGQASEIVNVDGLRPVYGDDICHSDNLSYREVSFKD